jgi:hypothetical protein
MKIDRASLAFFVLTALFLAVKLQTATYSISDENIYYYMGKLVSEG